MILSRTMSSCFSLLASVKQTFWSVRKMGLLRPKSMNDILKYVLCRRILLEFHPNFAVTLLNDDNSPKCDSKVSRQNAISKRVYQIYCKLRGFFDDSNESASFLMYLWPFFQWFQATIVKKVCISLKSSF